MEPEEDKARVCSNAWTGEMVAATAVSEFARSEATASEICLSKITACCKERGWVSEYSRPNCGNMHICI